jgi:metal-responsive CopG/Arc/MetJ family transcriptional regulator
VSSPVASTSSVISVSLKQELKRKLDENIIEELGDGEA